MCINLKMLGQCSSLIDMQRENILLWFFKEFQMLEKLQFQERKLSILKLGTLGCIEKNEDKDWPGCRAKSYPGIIKSKRISDGLLLTWYLWTFIVMYPFICLILSACPNTTYFLLQGENKSFCLKDFILYNPFSPPTWPCSEVKMTNLWHHNNFFLQEQTVKPLTQDGDFTAGSNKAAG